MMYRYEGSGVGMIEGEGRVLGNRCTASTQGPHPPQRCERLSSSESFPLSISSTVAEMCAELEPPGSRSIPVTGTSGVLLSAPSAARTSDADAASARAVAVAAATLALQCVAVSYVSVNVPLVAALTETAWISAIASHVANVASSRRSRGRSFMVYGCVE